ncbi:helix-turn-helix transcriptional regulator [Enterococcus faecalis]|uniref:helix-turn-helix domain-containing protein n=1 Tax=Enterococcus faecalis TaxID=1351 RepID=UPI0006665B65|nr:helix-turn-helix transcriptional regulator [Enterococcus faecalis]MDU3276944.1 helix-turn-helix transcriptional regulator [Veillonella sp.]MDU5861559.1 helix-turn-helix transcriptional regulator [Enterococcus faecalis]MDV2579446.1 helix-turn-helix transcriptional regulator [Enterococcus faecalis]MXS10822.1 helix-turn-helix domain-containing protein [Enterococcus faecalis]NSU27840.1 helix-turn-helix transcriptional regulator [Enterococcus faecalis]
MLYERIKSISEEKSLSIYKIERDLDFSNGTISKWNKSMPSAKNLKKVADYLGVDMEELLKTKGA